MFDNYTTLFGNRSAKNEKSVNAVCADGVGIYCCISTFETVIRGITEKFSDRLRSKNLKYSPL